MSNTFTGVPYKTPRRDVLQEHEWTPNSCTTAKPYHVMLPPSLLTFYFLCTLTVPKITCNWRWAGGNNACNSRCESWDPPLYSLLLEGVSNSITFTLDLATSILSHLVAMATWPRWYLHRMMTEWTCYVPRKKGYIITSFNFFCILMWDTPSVCCDCLITVG